MIDVDNTTGTSLENPPQADALVSACRGVALGIFTADCVPIFILDTETPAIGIAHAGWRGTFCTSCREHAYTNENLFRNCG